MPMHILDQHVDQNDVAVVEDPVPTKVGGLQGFVQIF